MIRHGQTDWNAEGRLQGQKDIGLNDKGRAQARHNGATLRMLVGDRVDQFDFVASPLSRTRETMQLARREMGLDPLAYRTDDRSRAILRRLGRPYAGRNPGGGSRPPQNALPPEMGLHSARARRKATRSCPGGSARGYSPWNDRPSASAMAASSDRCSNSWAAGMNWKRRAATFRRIVSW